MPRLSGKKRMTLVIVPPGYTAPIPMPARKAKAYTPPREWTKVRQTRPAPSRAPPLRISVRGCTYCWALPAMRLATAPAVTSAVNDSETSDADQPNSPDSGFKKTLQA